MSKYDRHPSPVFVSRSIMGALPRNKEVGTRRSMQCQPRVLLPSPIPVTMSTLVTGITSKYGRFRAHPVKFAIQLPYHWMPLKSVVK